MKCWDLWIHLAYSQIYTTHQVCGILHWISLDFIVLYCLHINSPCDGVVREVSNGSAAHVGLHWIAPTDAGLHFLVSQGEEKPARTIHTQGMI